METRTLTELQNLKVIKLHELGLQFHLGTCTEEEKPLEKIKHVQVQPQCTAVRTRLGHRPAMSPERGGGSCEDPGFTSQAHPGVLLFPRQPGSSGSSWVYPPASPQGSPVSQAASKGAGALVRAPTLLALPLQEQRTQGLHVPQSRWSTLSLEEWRTLKPHPWARDLGTAHTPSRPFIPHSGGASPGRGGGAKEHGSQAQEVHVGSSQHGWSCSPSLFPRPSPSFPVASLPPTPWLAPRPHRRPREGTPLALGPQW